MGLDMPERPDTATATDGPRAAARLVPRHAAAAALLARWDQVMTVPIVLAAVVPLVLAPSPDTSIVVVLVAVVAWLVFVADLAVRTWCLPGYLGTWAGRLDLFIVVVTFPWILVGLGSGGRIAGLFRLARLLRLLVAGRRLRRFAEVMNRVVIVAAGMLALCSFIVMKAEGPANGFDDYGDALWWGIVTLTTVGYGDLVPQTTTGQLTAAILMVTGIGLLGALAGTLANVLHLDPGDDGVDPSDGADAQSVAARLDAIEAHLAALREHLSSGDVPTPAGELEPPHR